MTLELTYTAFAGDQLLVTDTLKEMLLRTKAYLDGPAALEVLIFEDQTGRQIDFDFRGTPDDVLARLGSHPLFCTVPDPSKAPSGPGRPRLGVVCREVSLLPRHWEWLEKQSGGSSAALRRLVDEARKREPEKEDVGALRDAAGKFMLALAGNLPHFEEVTRALYAGDYGQAGALTEDWPKDIAAHAVRLMARCAQAEEQSSRAT